MMSVVSTMFITCSTMLRVNIKIKTHIHTTDLYVELCVLM